MNLNMNEIKQMTDKDITKKITYLKEYAKWFRKTSLESAYDCDNYLIDDHSTGLRQDINFLEAADDLTLLPDVYFDLVKEACLRGLDS